MKDCALPSKSKTYAYINGLPIYSAKSNYIIKIANSTELVSCLPSPANLQRNLNTVPDVDIRLLLSTSARLPKRIARQITRSENKDFFTNKSLLGLCISGRRMPVEIFLHDYLIMKSDPSGEIFEEVVWHEIVHGLEGIEYGSDGDVIRRTPWSYELQQVMLEMDARNGHAPILPDHPKKSAHSMYLRRGTSLQDHVSEIFARIAVIFMYQIKETGLALTSGDDLFALTSVCSKDVVDSSRKNSNISDFLNAWGTFSDEAQLLFVQEIDAVIKRVAHLYGCDIGY